VSVRATGRRRPRAAEHNYRLIIVDRVVRGDGHASLINPRPRFPCRLRHLARP